MGWTVLFPISVYQVKMNSNEYFPLGYIKKIEKRELKQSCNREDKGGKRMDKKSKVEINVVKHPKLTHRKWN